MDRGVANLTLTITMEGIDHLQRELFKIYQGTVASGIDPSKACLVLTTLLARAIDKAKLCTYMLYLKPFKKTAISGGK